MQTNAKKTSHMHTAQTWFYAFFVPSHNNCLENFWPQMFQIGSWSTGIPAVPNSIRIKAISLSQASSSYTLDVTLYSEFSSIDVSPSHCQSSLNFYTPFCHVASSTVLQHQMNRNKVGEMQYRLKKLGPKNNVFDAIWPIVYSNTILSNYRE